MSGEFVEKENRWRLEQLLHLIEQRLQELTREAWDARRHGSPDTKKFLPHQQLLVKEGQVEEWDVSLCVAVLKKLEALGKEEKDAAQAIANARNACAHAVGGRVTSESFDTHYKACSSAYEVLGGSADALQQILTNEIDSSDVRVLSCSREATMAAEREKMEGNRLFYLKSYRDAKERYTRGLQIAGAVDSMVQAQLYNNRSTTSFHLKEFASAKEDAKHAAELAPQWAKPQLCLAQIYDEMYKHHTAVARLEMALGIAEAAHDDKLIMEISKKMPEFRLRRDEATRRESENLAYGPMHENEGAFREANQARFGLDETQDPNALLDNVLSLDLESVGIGAKKHVIAGHRAHGDGRLADAAREFMAGALGGDTEGMFNYALALQKGRGTRKSIPEAVQWLEKAAETPLTGTMNAAFNNIGIGEAMATLGNLYNSGVHFHQDMFRAREYWERAADLGTAVGLNMFALCLMDGSHGAQQDLPRAREMFRRSAEQFHNEAMSNLAALHASLHEFETAARWEDTAYKFGFIPAAGRAHQYREMAATKESLPKQSLELLDSIKRPLTFEEPNHHRQNKTPTLDELRAINTPYGKRLLAAKELMMKATQGFTLTEPEAFFREIKASGRAALVRVVQLAAKARRVEDGDLVFSTEESRAVWIIAEMLKDMGTPLTPDMALLLHPDPSAFVTFWKSMQRRFPDDFVITRYTACACMFAAYAGADAERGLQMFQRAMGLLPRADSDYDPQTIGLWYEAAVAYYQTGGLDRAESLFKRFLQHAAIDGHRKAAEAHYILGNIVLLKSLPDEPHLPGKRRKTDKKAKAATKKANAAAKKAATIAVAHLREGDRLLQRVPPFLRDAAQNSPNRKVLERHVSLAGESVAVALPTTASDCRKRGGELVPGPRRHRELRSESSMLRSMWRKSIADMAELNARTSGETASSLTPTRQSTASTSTGYTSATIDELFSALEDHVYTGRVIECIAVSVPSFNGSSFHFVVEDSQREPARIAVYSASKSFMNQLIPGRVLRLLNPYVRLAQDGTIMLRVDNPSSTIEMGAQHAICWVCAVEQQNEEPLRCCTKCHKARYCSEQCQAQDWSIDGHRFLCATFRYSSSGAALMLRKCPIACCY